MTGTQLPVVVGVDGSPGSDAALRWAVADAKALTAPLRLLHAYRWDPASTPTPLYRHVPEADLQMPRHIAEQAVDRLVARATELGATDVDGVAIDSDPVDALLSEARFAREIVVGSRHLKAMRSTVLGSVGAAVAARAESPVVVVRGPAGVAAERAGVVVGVDGSERSRTVLEFGFEYASRHKVPLRAVLCWYPDMLALMSWRAEPPPPEQVDAWLADALMGWRQKFPDVVVHPEVIREHPIGGLLLASRAQHLLVVGSHGHRARTGTLLGSVSQGVLHSATCPVAVLRTS
jgi:nucleotide-binding universal stress UspA family protein